jgi:predicted transcriptional regulator
VAKQNQKPSQLEMQVLTVLWDQGPTTVRNLLDQLPDGKQRAYTTVLTVLQVMEKKGFVSHERQGQAYVYAPEINREQVMNPVMKNLLQNMFGGDMSSVVQCLIDSSDVGSDELKAIRKVINAAARKQQDDGGR